MAKKKVQSSRDNNNKNNNKNVTPKINPFERRTQNKKFEILGRKIKGQEQKFGESRTKATSIRKKNFIS